MTDRYRVRYKIEVDAQGWTKAELGEDGGADALIIHSIMYEPDGGRSEMILSTNGEGELKDIELFRSWLMMAHRLITAPGLTQEGRDLVRGVFEHVRAQVTDLA